MKRLYLLRHAKSSWKDFTLSDFDRPLNKRGKRDAPLMAQKLKEMGIRPDIIISSPAKRARKTAKIFAKTLHAALETEEKLYEAHTSDIKEVIQTAFEKYDAVMIVGHNPGLTMFNDEISDIPIFNIPTTGVVGIGFQNDDTSLDKGSQLFFEYPRKYAPHAG
ncbi:SixA phosphatase family protein [Sulfurovum sp. ST-21]|uniref:Histidine phosphatase family protein n=2 Tax=Sulfurovum indicum TaxID=2779528 RepID=A0A7M1S768_9BACT|nr:histidine phosphatase family protein [Sulfurovum indicum]